MKTFFTSFGVSLFLTVGSCLAADSYTPDGAPIYSVTAKGKNEVSASGNARVAALRSAMKEMAGDSFIKEHSNDLRKNIILQYKEFTEDPRVTSSEKSEKFVQIKADVVVDAKKLSESLISLGAQVTQPELRKTEPNSANIQNTGNQNNGFYATPDDDSWNSKDDSWNTEIVNPSTSDGKNTDVVLANDGLDWLRAIGLIWQGSDKDSDGNLILTDVRIPEQKDASSPTMKAERLILKNMVSGNTTSEPVTVDLVRLENIVITDDSPSNTIEIRVPSMETRGCRFIPKEDKGNVHYLPESEIGKGNPDFSAADIAIESINKSSSNQIPVKVSIKSIGNKNSNTGQTGKISGVSIDDGEGNTVHIAELTWNDLLIPSIKEISNIIDSTSALSTPVEAAMHGGEIALKEIKGKIFGVSLDLAGISFRIHPTDDNKGRSFRLALESLVIPPALIDLIPDIPVDVVKEILPEGEKLDLAFEGRVIPAKPSNTPSTVQFSLNAEKLCDFDAKAEFMFDVENLLEPAQNGALSTAALLESADKISIKKTDVRLTDRKLLGLALAVGGKLMQTKPSELLPQMTFMLDSMKPQSPATGTDKIVSALIETVQPVLAALGGIQVSLEFPTPLKLSAPDIPSDVIVTTSATQLPTPVIESLPENLR